MNISKLVFYESITQIEDLSSEAKQVIQDNYDAMDELEDYIEENIGTMDNDGVLSVDIGILDDYLKYGIKEDKAAQEILKKYLPKYRMTNITKLIEGKLHHRIVALKDFSNVSKGEYGGWVFSEANLSQEGDCWIDYDAVATETSYVGGNARLMDEAVLRGAAQVRGNAMVKAYAEIEDSAKVYGIVSGNAIVGGNIVVERGSEVSGKICLAGHGTITLGTVVE